MGIKVGCCGFPVARDKYFQSFQVVELQQTFYQPPKLETVIKWQKDSPKEFEFCLKAWQLITHPPTSPTYRRLKIPIPTNKTKNYGFFRPTDEVFSAWQKTESIAETLNAKVIVFQCPASFTSTQENKQNLRKFFSSILRKNFTFAWEPRGNWSEKDIIALCKDLDLVHCVDPFKAQPLYGKIIYLRLHGRQGYRYKYTEGDLKNLIKKIKKGVNCYIMFNNIYMFADASCFLNLIKKYQLEM